MALSTAQIQNAYVAFFNRPADVAGLNYWSSYSGNAADLLNTFAESVEYKDLYAGLNSTQLVNAVYQNLFGRSPDVEGLTYWVGQLDNGALKIGNFADAVSKGAQSTDADIVANKVAAATAFTESLDTTAEIVAYASANSTALTAVKTWLNTVTSDAASVTAATGAPLTAVLGTVQNNSNSNGTVGQTFTLTDKVGENIVGTAGNDTFNAVLGNTGALASATDSTLNIGDSIDGAAGEDTLNITLAGAAANGTVPAGVVVKNVEKVFLTHTNNAALAAVAAGNLNHSGTYAGVKELWQVDTSAAAGTFGGVQVAADVVAGFKSTGTANAVVVAPATLVTGSATQKAISIAFDGVGSGSGVEVVGAALETVTLTGSVATAAGANAAELETVATVKTVNLGLTSNTTVTFDTTVAGDVAGIATVDLSKSTGNVTIDLSNAAFAAVKSVKGGAGNDTLTVDFDNNADKLAVDAGAGNDTVTVQATVAAGTNITNEGTVTLGAGKDTLTIGAVSNISVTNTTAADAVTLVQNLITVTDFKTGEDVLNFNGNGIALSTGQLDTAKLADTLLAAVQSVEAITGAAGDRMAVFSWGGDAYVFIDDGDTNGVDGGDGLIKLTGVDATEFTNIQNGNLVL